MNLRLILCFISFFCFTNLYSQHFVGITLDLSTKEPISGVNIYSIKTGIGTVSDKDGKFVFSNEKKLSSTDTIYFSCIGFKTRRIPLKELKKQGNIILLSIDIKEIEEIKIVSERFIKSQINYEKLEPSSYGIYSFGSIILDNKIFIIGGDRSIIIDNTLKDFNETGNMKAQPNFTWFDYSCDLNIYDIDSKQWQEPKSLFTNRAYHNIISYKDKLYLIGGKKLSLNSKIEFLNNEIEIYNSRTDSVVIDHTNPHQAANYASFLYKDNIILMGGSVKLDINKNKVYTADIHLYDLKTGYWYKVGNMPVAKETKGICIDDKIYLIGGFNKAALRDIETYDLNTGEWHKVGELSKEAERPGIAYNNGIIYIFSYGRIYTLDINKKQLKEYLIDLDLKYAELFYYNSKLLRL